ncbi:DUF4232 domain-containing protein [Umezawaea endophytica]|uniref:DUF4232 domain-containing protein n=1 Tax=Umezawaea endophytica TaxID=1654476 RepID=A0A9X2VQD5_9PSEU|nr:DUF4232 domain-containing protein [Umezawaea endophytica]MCS7480776.1 DUF4232 domain-containing protein [Umezawaea endophytica]
MRSNKVFKGSAAIIAMAAVAAVSACSTAGSTTATQTHGPSPSSSTATDGAKSLTGNTTGSTTADNCQEIDVSLGDPLPSDKTQSKVGLTMLNTGPTNCVLRGFPGVRLVGKDGKTWDLSRTNDPVVDVELAPGSTAISYLTYLPTTDTTGWDVAAIQITPPNTSNTQTFKWPLGNVVLQDGATHPGTYISTVVAPFG